MASKAKAVKAAKKGRVAGPKAKGGAVAATVKAGMALVGGGEKKKEPGTGKRRRRGPEYWAKKVLVERLKKKYWRAKFGGK